MVSGPRAAPWAAAAAQYCGPVETWSVTEGVATAGPDAGAVLVGVVLVWVVVFGVTNWGRLVFCGSPRRYESRWFRSPEMHGIKNEGDACPANDGEVAQAPDGLFLTCVSRDGGARWERGDL